jgi:hypothetical protein
VKPGNILITTGPEGEHAYVCDFGLARHVSSVSSLTGDRGFVGTIDYVPPEQIEGGQIDGRADVYSLGCMLYECLAGERPFDRESELSVVFAHLNEPPPHVSDVRTELPQAFDAVFETALAKSPDERYSTCGELVAAARTALQGKTFVRRKLRRRRLVLAAGVVLAAAGAGIGSVLATKSDSTSAGPPAITQTSIAGAKLGLTAAAYKTRFGGWRAETLTEPKFPALVFQDPQIGRLLSGEGPEGEHHHDLEQGVPHHQRDWPLLDRPRDEEGLRRWGPTIVGGHLTRQENRMGIHGRQEPALRRATDTAKGGGGGTLRRRSTRSDEARGVTVLRELRGPSRGALHLTANRIGPRSTR